MEGLENLQNTLEEPLKNLRVQVESISRSELKDKQFLELISMQMEYIDHLVSAISSPTDLAAGQVEYISRLAIHNFETLENIINEPLKSLTAQPPFYSKS